jgi:mannosyltransferase OCH1-like enzyme
MIKTYKDLKGRTWDQPGIPKWIFRAGNDSLEDLHPDVVELYNKQLEDNPEYELFYFSQEDKLQFIKDLNNLDVEEAYNVLIPISYKTDLFRFAITSMYGGVYMDFSMQTLIPLEDIINGNYQVLARDSASHFGICTGFIATIKGSDLLNNALEKSVYNANNRLMGEDPLDVTGPNMIGSVYKKLNNVEHIELGKISNSVYMYDFAEPNYIYNGDDKIIKIRLPNHYSLLYKAEEKNVYYADLWHSGKIYNSKVIKTYRNLKGKTWKEEGIPKWIFKTGPFELDNLPEVYKYIYQDILKNNPGYELFYFSNKDCIDSLRDHYGEDYVALHQKLIPTAYQADFWRYCILNIYGGCYGDFSQVPLVPYNEIIEGVDRVFARDDPSSKSSLYNAVMCSKPGDEVVYKAMKISENNIRTNNYGIGSLDITGPIVLGKAFIQIKYKNRTGIKEISLGDYNGSRILQHRGSGNFVGNSEKNIFVTKLRNHSGVVYNPNNNNIHYDKSWAEKKVFR